MIRSTLTATILAAALVASLTAASADPTSPEDTTTTIAAPTTSIPDTTTTTRPELVSASHEATECTVTLTAGSDSTPYRLAAGPDPDSPLADRGWADAGTLAPGESKSWTIGGGYWRLSFPGVEVLEWCPPVVAPPVDPGEPSEIEAPEPAPVEPASDPIPPGFHDGGAGVVFADVESG